MAELISNDVKSKLVLLPINYEQKDEFWFSSEVNLIHEELSLVKGHASFQLNDFLSLIIGAEDIINNKHNIFEFNPIEPYLKMSIKLLNGSYYIEIYFCKGPVFESSEYKEIKFITTRRNLINFINQIKTELKNVDANLESKITEKIGSTTN